MLKAHGARCGFKKRETGKGRTMDSIIWAALLGATITATATVVAAMIPRQKRAQPDSTAKAPVVGAHSGIAASPRAARPPRHRASGKTPFIEFDVPLNPRPPRKMAPLSFFEMSRGVVCKEGFSKDWSNLLFSTAACSCPPACCAPSCATGIGWSTSRPGSTTTAWPGGFCHGGSTWWMRTGGRSHRQSFGNRWAWKKATPVIAWKAP